MKLEPGDGRPRSDSHDKRREATQGLHLDRQAIGVSEPVWATDDTIGDQLPMNVETNNPPST